MGLAGTTSSSAGNRSSDELPRDSLDLWNVDQIGNRYNRYIYDNKCKLMNLVIKPMFKDLKRQLLQVKIVTLWFGNKQEKTFEQTLMVEGQFVNLDIARIYVWKLM